MIPIKPAGSTESRMTGEGQFLGRCEDAHPNSTLVFELRCARKDECCLREIGFTSEGLHLGVREASGIGKDAQLVAFERSLGEDINLRVVERDVSGGWRLWLMWQ